MYKVIKYTTSNGECPIDSFIKELIIDGCLNDVQKIKSYIRLLEINGEAILRNSTWAKKLTSNIYELRPKSNRILFYLYLDDQFILLHGFKKKTQKTPTSEINKAIKEAKDFERRNSNGN
ncbi:MAG: type II toxin-antitoxin system RelE/ParE family toxin [Acholeplasmatales bacterium]|nr:type II toxin-antitoxin system RelE/ParE family toxin [Acholeplasmatales bacterium]